MIRARRLSRAKLADRRCVQRRAIVEADTVAEREGPARAVVRELPTRASAGTTAPCQRIDGDERLEDWRVATSDDPSIHGSSEATSEGIATRNVPPVIAGVCVAAGGFVESVQAPSTNESAMSKASDERIRTPV